MLTKTQLLGFHADPYRPIIEGWGQAANAVSSASNTISSTADQMYDWTGQAADQAVTTMGDLVAVVVNVPQLFNEAQDTLGAFVAAVYQQQQILTAALHKAAQLGCTVDDDGTVNPPSQPPGEPPQECPPDPTLAAKWAREQQAYNSSPAVQSWQAATQQAPGLQTTIQGALQAATAADGRANRDLQAGIQGGTDVRKIVTGQDRTGSYTQNLYADTQAMADGHRWMEQDVHQVAALLPKAANGDKSAAAQLAQLTPLSWDQDFGATLMNQLGPAGLEKLPVEMGERAQALGKTDPADPAILQFIGNSLASASNSPNLPPGFIQALTNDATAQYQYTALEQFDDSDKGPHPSVMVQHTGTAGLWSLGQILGATNGAVAFNPQFLTAVGTAIINSDKGEGFDYPGPFISWGANTVGNPGGDPVYGLMNAATHSPAAAQMLFSSGQNLNNLLGLPWTYDHGSSLGAALQAAITGPATPTTDKLTTNLVNDLAQHYKMDPGYEAQTSGLNTHVANILSQYQDLTAIEWTVNEPTNFGSQTSVSYKNSFGQSITGPAFDQVNLAVVLGNISQTPKAYQTLSSNAAIYMQDGLNEAVNKAMQIQAPAGVSGINSEAGYNEIQSVLGPRMAMLSYLAGAQALVGQYGANIQAADIQKQLSDDSQALNIIWAVAGAFPGAGPIIGGIAGVAGAGAGIAASNVSASNASTVKGAAEAISIPRLATYELAYALLKNDPSLGENQSFVQNGNLPSYPKLSPTGLGAVTQWLNTIHYGMPDPGFNPEILGNYGQLLTGPGNAGAQSAQQDVTAGGVVP